MKDKQIVDSNDLDRVRLDKWLWAARFFKTRSIAARQMGGGKPSTSTASAPSLQGRCRSAIA